MAFTRAVLALVLSALLSACASQAHVEHDVRLAMQALHDADEALDAEGVVALLADDFFMLMDGVRTAREDVVTQIRSTLPTLQSFDTDFENVEVLVISSDAALVSMTFRDRIVDASGDAMASRGPSTFLWRKRDGAWLISYLDADHYAD